MQFNSRTGSAAAGASTKENPRRKYATGYAGLAWLVRGSSRRIMIMRFRPANISLINPRHFLPRLLLTLSSFEKKRPAHLDRSLHITSVSATTRPRPWKCRFAKGRSGEALVMNLKQEGPAMKRIQLIKSFMPSTFWTQVRPCSFRSTGRSLAGLRCGLESPRSLSR